MRAVTSSGARGLAFSGWFRSINAQTIRRAFSRGALNIAARTLSLFFFCANALRASRALSRRVRSRHAAPIARFFFSSETSATARLRSFRARIVCRSLSSRASRLAFCCSLCGDRCVGHQRHQRKLNGFVCLLCNAAAACRTLEFTSRRIYLLGVYRFAACTNSTSPLRFLPLHAPLCDIARCCSALFTAISQTRMSARCLRLLACWRLLDIGVTSNLACACR